MERGRRGSRVGTKETRTTPGTEPPRVAYKKTGHDTTVTVVREGSSD